MMQQFSRKLTSAEKRILRVLVANRKTHQRRNVPRAFLGGLVMFGVLCGLTVAVSDAPVPIVVAFWVVAGLFISTWAAFSAHRSWRRTVSRLEGALRTDRANVTRIASLGMVAFEEIDDEGACYAFQLPDNRVVFICGQGFYPTAKFPNSDFSLVDLLDEDGALVYMLIAKHGEKLDPARIVPANIKKTLRPPMHLEIVEGNLSSLESCLAR